VTSERDDLLKAVDQLKNGINGFKTQLDQSESKRRAVRRKSAEKFEGYQGSLDEMVKIKAELEIKDNECAIQLVREREREREREGG
jgi:hypothetical protein